MIYLSCSFIRWKDYIIKYKVFVWKLQKYIMHSFFTPLSFTGWRIIPYLENEKSSK